MGLLQHVKIGTEGGRVQEHPENSKIGQFCMVVHDYTVRYRLIEQNLASKRTSSAGSRVPNVAVIGKRRWAQGPPKLKKLVKISAFLWIFHFGRTT